jgi:signal transduction histidine kinase
VTSKVDEISAATLSLLTRADPDTAAILYLLESDDGSLSLRGSSGFVKLEDLREQVPLTETGLASLIGGGTQVRILPPQDGYALFRSPTAAAAAIRHLAGAPVSGDDGVRGVLILARRAGQAPDHTEHTLLEAAAALVGTRLNRARLADLLERAKGQLMDVTRLAAVGELVPGVTHEVNNALTTVLGHTQLLLMRPDVGEHLRQRLELVASEGTRMARLIQNLLAFSRPRPPERRSCSLADQARRVLELKAYQLHHDNVRVVTEFGDSPAVHADEREIQHALLALVQRALEAMRERSTERVLILRTGAEDGRAWVDVFDTGPTVVLEFLGRLADPLEPGAARGPGLALAHRIVSDHGGRLQGSPRPEGGMRFSIVLPAGR